MQVRSIELLAFAMPLEIIHKSLQIFKRLKREFTNRLDVILANEYIQQVVFSKWLSANTIRQIQFIFIRIGLPGISGQFFTVPRWIIEFWLLIRPFSDKIFIVSCPSLMNCN